MSDTTTKPKGRGWHGDSAAHARAGRLGGLKSPGNFRYDREKASLAGKKSGGNFAKNPERAAKAGAIGGSRTKRYPTDKEL